jgi:hypothetical protein
MGISIWSIAVSIFDFVSFVLFVVNMVLYERATR